jgi:fibronectin-binding autotransporter adhesin
MFHRRVALSRPDYAQFGRVLQGLAWIFCVCATANIGAQTWNGGGANNLWSTGANWSVAPVNNGTAALAFAGSTRLTPDMDANWNILSLAFNSGAGAFILGSTGSFTLTIQGGGITNNSTSTETINNKITLGAAQTWSATSGNLSFGGNIANGGFLLTIGGGSNTSASGIISGTGGLTKSGAGTLTLTGANSYTGATLISAGVLNIQTNTGLGTAAGGTTVNSGAALQIQNSITVGNEALTLNGSGIANDGALRNISGTNSMSGAITLGSATTIGSDAGTLTLSGALNNAGFLLTETGAGNLTMSGVISGAGGLTMNGSGTLILSGASANTYSGTTTVNSGVLALNKTAAINALAGSLVVGDNVSASGSATVRLLAANQLPDTTAVTLNSSGVLDWNGFIDKVGATTLYSGDTSGASIITGAGAIHFTGTLTLGVSGTGAFGATIAGNLVDGGAIRTIFVNDGAADADLTISAVVQGSKGYIKDGAGRLVLSGVNTDSGAFTISAGPLQIQNVDAISSNSGVTVSSGGALEFAGGHTFNPVPVTLNGSGVGGTGAILNVSGTNSFAGALTIASATTFGSDSGSLTLSDTFANAGFLLTTTGAGNLTFSGVISGTGGLTKNGAGTLILSGADTYTGATTVNAGTLQISASERIANLGNLAVSGGTFDLQTFTETVGGVTLSSGSIIGTGTGTLIGSSYTLQSGSVSAILGGTAALTKNTSGTVTVSGANTYSGGTAINGGTLLLTSSGALGSSGTISFGGGTLKYSGSNTTDYSSRFSSGLNQAYSIDTNSQNVTLASALSSSGGTFTKLGSGTLTLSIANSYTGSTIITAGTLQLNINGALGTVAAGTTVSNGAALKLNGLNYSTAEALTLNGSGITNTGALINSGTSTFAGAINVATSATISAGGGTLNLTGGIAKNGTTLTFAGGGTVNILTNGITGSSANSDLVIDGTTVVLDVANSYNGPTTVQNSGVLQLGASNVLPSSPQTALTVNTSSVFDMASFSDGVASLAGDSTATVKNSVAGGTSTLTVNPTTGVSTTFAGVIAGTSGGTQGNIALIKAGAGTTVLIGTNTYTGATTVNAGSLFVNGSTASGSAVTVNNSGSTLGGSGTIGGSVNIASSGANLSPGASGIGSTAILHTGALTLASGSNFNVDLNSTTAGTGYDQLNVIGALSITGSNLVVAAGAGLHIGDKFFIALNDGSDAVTGTFAQGTTVTSGADVFLINYLDNGDGGGTANDISLTVTGVPEPSTYVAAILALAALAYHQRKRFGRSRKIAARS